MKIIPKIKKDFDWVKWSVSDIKFFGKRYIDKVAFDYQEIKAIPKNERNFENTVYSFVSAGKLDIDIEPLLFLEYVSKSKSVREASNKMSVVISKALTDLSYDEDLYHSFLEYNPKKEKLNEEEKRLYDDVKRLFKNKGLHLPKSEQKKLAAISKQISELGSNFTKNISDYDASILCTKEELSGLPLNFIQNLKRDRKTKKYIVSIAYPEIGPFSVFADNEKKRKELIDKNASKGGKQNLKILKKLLLLRHEYAKILGYDSYSAFAVENRISKDPKKIKYFLESTLSNLKPRVVADVKNVEKFVKKEFGIQKLTYYNSQYLTNKLRKKLYDYDPNLVKEYFVLENVMDYMFNLFGSLFGVTFKRKEIELWNKEVIFFDVIDSKKTVGHIVFDLFPRKGKFSHMACWALLPGHADVFHGDKYLAPVSVIVGNFPRGTKKSPSLLSISEIETLFHEFGHMMHGVLSRAKYESQSGTNVDFDFVEMPSQLFENWAKDKDIIFDMSKHYKTGNKLSPDILAKIVAVKDFMVSSEYYGVFVGGIEDILYHTTNFNKSIEETVKYVDKKYRIIPRSPKSLWPAGWGHMTDYAASYYTYTWSLVYSYDIFSRFKKEGVKNKKVGYELREKILSKGSSIDELKLMEDFLGRKPNNKAFLQAFGTK